MDAERAAPTRYAAFGDLRVTTPAGEQPISRRRERDTLCVLLAHQAPVPPDRLLAEVWPSGSALGPLQVVVSRLRSVLEPDRRRHGGSRHLVSTSAGYAVRAATTDVDTWLFEHLASRCLADADAASAAAFHEQAEALWTGRPYGECEAESVVAARRRLAELRVAASERAAEALLELGHPQRVVLVLGELTGENPFRERLFYLLAIALYRSGRQSEALATLRELRRRLAEELGVDPTPEVRRLEHDLLHQSHDLDRGDPVDDPTLPRRTVTTDARVPDGDREQPEPLLGREEPLTRIAALLDSLADGGRRVVTVIGEPGVGKSRLAAEVVSLAADRGIASVVGQCHEGDVAPALWPWTQVVRTLVDRFDVSDPLLRPLLDDGASTTDTGSGSLPLFEALSRLLDDAAAGDGLLVVLEDIHWSDSTSLQALAHLVERRSGSPVLVLVTRRSTVETGSSELLGTLAVLARAGAERVRLDGLDRDAVGRLLRRHLREVPERVVTVVDDATSGNPFFVEEYARLLRTLGDLDALAELPVPDGVRDVIGQRVGRLPEDARRLLLGAAVLGREIEPEDAAALAGQGVADALDHLDLALATGLLVERGRSYLFAHALTRETLYAGATAARRLRLHARASDVLAARLGNSPDAAADIAFHALLAAPLGETFARTAMERLGNAAEVALSRQAPIEARRLWEQARDLAERWGLVDEQLTAMLGVARCAVRMGTFTEAPRLVADLAREASRRGRWDLVVAAAATFHRAGAWTWRVHGRKDEDLIEVLTAALPHVSGADEAVLCGTLLVEHQFGWDTVASDTYAERAVHLARQSGDRPLLCSVLLARLIATAGRADLGGRSFLAEELLDAGPTGEIEVAALFHLGFALHEEGRVTEAEEAMALARDRADSLMHSGLDVPLAWWAYSVARDHDDPGADRLGRAALDAHLGRGFYYGTELQTLHAVLALPPGGRLPDSVVAQAREGLHAQRALVAWSLVEAGEPELAAEVLGPPLPEHAVDYSVEASLCLRILVAAALGRVEDVSGLLQRVDRYTTPLAVYGSVDHLGAFDHFRAVAHRALGDPSRALALARSAVSTNLACDIRPWLRRSRSLVRALEAETDEIGP